MSNPEKLHYNEYRLYGDSPPASEREAFTERARQKFLTMGFQPESISVRDIEDLHPVGRHGPHWGHRLFASATAERRATRA